MFAIFTVVSLACCDRDPPDPKAALGSAPATLDPAYIRDIESVCDVLARSGAVEREGPERMFTVATWLGQNLVTPEARAFLARIEPLPAEAKADAFTAEARRVGLSRCALAEVWRGRG